MPGDDHGGDPVDPPDLPEEGGPGDTLSPSESTDSDGLLNDVGVGYPRRAHRGHIDGAPRTASRCSTSSTSEAG